MRSWRKAAKTGAVFQGPKGAGELPFSSLAAPVAGAVMLGEAQLSPVKSSFLGSRPFRTSRHATRAPGAAGGPACPSGRRRDVRDSKGSQMRSAVHGIDLGKNSRGLAGLDAQGTVVKRRRISRAAGVHQRCAALHRRDGGLPWRIALAVFSRRRAMRSGRCRRVQTSVAQKGSARWPNVSTTFS
jgi:hypothetical protein